jgi:hypothetical protein
MIIFRFVAGLFQFWTTDMSGKYFCLSFCDSDSAVFKIPDMKVFLVEFFKVHNLP